MKLAPVSPDIPSTPFRPDSEASNLTPHAVTLAAALQDKVDLRALRGLPVAAFEVKVDELRKENVPEGDLLALRQLYQELNA